MRSSSAVRADRPLSRKRRYLWLLLLAGVLALAAALLLLGPRRPPAPEQANPLQLGRFVASPEFLKLTAEERKDFMQAVEKRQLHGRLEENLTPAEQNNFRRNMTRVDIDRARFFFQQDQQTQEALLAEASKSRRDLSPPGEGPGGNRPRPTPGSGSGTKPAPPGDQAGNSHRRYLEGVSVEDRAVMNAFARRLDQYKK